mmetsp:Transcript_24396/g.49419  ORF Transcript_24396/g.49419 Transcript_24396/m.49419 type:complete len:80 (+) Transcript_24396:284-523(+)
MFTQTKLSAKLALHNSGNIGNLSPKLIHHSSSSALLWLLFFHLSPTQHLHPSLVITVSFDINNSPPGTIIPNPKGSCNI